jgi:hypothetical protein
MTSYLINWFHAYLVHFGVWVSLISGSSLYQKGLPEMKRLPNMFKTVLILSAVLAIFSSHSHVHYASILTQLAK